MKPLKWKDYCPSMPCLKTWEDVKRRQINKEDEANHPITEKWKTMKVEIPKYQQPYKEVWYNFLRGILNP